MMNLDQYLIEVEDYEEAKIVHKSCGVKLALNTEELIKIIELPKFHICPPDIEHPWWFFWDGKKKILNTGVHYTWTENSSKYLKES